MKTRILYLLVLSVMLAACKPGPKPIQYGSDECSYCKMMITESEFASQIVNQQGKTFGFDSVECMMAYDVTAEDSTAIHSRWVPDFHSGEWIMAESAVFLHSKTLRSPMGLNLSAYQNRQQAREMQREYGGDMLNYQQAKKIVEDNWLNSHSTSHPVNH